MERDFYKLHRVTDADIKLIWWLAAEKAHPLTQQLHKEFLSLITAPMEMLGSSEAMVEELDLYQTNALEDFYSGLENSFLPLLERILAGDIKFYQNEHECILFFYFVCNQYMRTKAIKVRIIEDIKRLNGLDLAHVWNILSYIYAVNIGCGLFGERGRRQLVLLQNHTDVPFITGDQPVINLSGARPKPPEQLQLYYPVSPNRALILSEVDEAPAFISESLTLEDVFALNAKIAQASHSQIFGPSRKSLLQVRGQMQNLEEI